MRSYTLPIAAALVLTACVTINVYFPAAEAREAAREFVEKVIGDEGATPAVPESEGPANDASGNDVPGDGAGGMALLPADGPRRVAFDPWMLLGIAPAHAQAPDISIRTPAIQAIQQRMESRFTSTLRPHFDSGALGFGSDGLLVVRDAARLPLKDRVAVNAAVADDNRDRNAVYREIAVANGHPEWESQIRDVFAKQWVASARSGWWYQQGGSWRQK
ncbi:YdbL family protein [Luteimonas sp. MJ250]|uniref:YdbL family protein n=1 Tax=Luteimonas sp. MJ250 TaxID=3129236 RepID=UPI0031BB3379